ncbi:hypothetical protein PF002_g1304 [Phytophthora fragariae]|uniref:Uncharacterized protein n=1 Tax=Phytophthora fragariae TaxID=53985 RepID=A0A6A4AFN0_9STRA|nr:hypothetical protein PF002_g1304 [Phytophthora fragariae]
MVDLKTDASDAFYGQHIMRRYVEEISIVFVWNTYIEPSVLENEPVSANSVLGCRARLYCHLSTPPGRETLRQRKGGQWTRKTQKPVGGVTVLSTFGCLTVY